MQPVRYLDRATGTLETEHIYGEPWLRLAYGHPAGPLLLHGLVKHRLFSRWFARRMKHPSSRRLIAPFISRFNLDPEEFADPPETFATFNDFFVRRLKPEARPVHPAPDTAVFGCDGRHLGFPDASRIDAVFAKGQRFDLPALLGSTDLAARYARGTLVLSRLCPTDYHRFHFPAGGTPDPATLLNGPLFSVSPLALRRNLSFLWQNKRLLTPFHTEPFGTILLLEIGATNVGSIRQTHPPRQPARKGDEKGFFEFGGSALITLFEPRSVKLAPDLLDSSARHIELFAPFGSPMATAP